MKKSLYKTLLDYVNKDIVPMHMPGAKRNCSLIDMPNPYAIDITEIDTFDNLHNPSGILKDEMIKAAKLWGADEALFLINGSSVGILSAISALLNKSDKILVARNCHISVFNAIELNDLEATFINPDLLGANIYSGIRAEEVEKAFRAAKEPFKALIITSPTYEGVVSQIKEIAEFVHSYGAYLIVDEAHGAHFPFNNYFPQSANSLGADAVIMSLHKTLPSLTQTGLLCLNSSSIDLDKVKYYWSLFQTTSPSYILMSSISACMDLIEEKGEVLFKNYVHLLEEYRKKIKVFLSGYGNEIELLENDDKGKIVIKAPRANLLMKAFRDKGIELELATSTYLVAMTSIADDRDKFKEFFKALKDIVKDYYSSKKFFIDAEVAFNNDLLKTIDLLENSIAKETLIIYPPGIPEVFKGDIITKANIVKIKEAIKEELQIIGLEKFIDING